MARIGLADTGKWHLLGKHQCHHVVDSTIVETQAFNETELTDPEWGSVGIPTSGPLDARWCRRCEDTLSRLSRQRFNAVIDLKERVPYRDVEWEQVSESGDCPWCGKEASAAWYNEQLGVTVCRACAYQYNHTFFEVEPPEEDLRVPTPDDSVDPVLNIAEESGQRNREWKQTQEEYRPYIQVATKQKYAEVECRMHATGHRLSTEAADQISQLQKQRKQQAKDNPDHKSQVMTLIDDNRRIIRSKTLFPDAAQDHAEDIAEIVRNPDNWSQ